LDKVRRDLLALHFQEARENSGTLRGFWSLPVSGATELPAWIGLALSIAMAFFAYSPSIVVQSAWMLMLAMLLPFTLIPCVLWCWLQATKLHILLLTALLPRFRSPAQAISVWPEESIWLKTIRGWAGGASRKPT
jgi:hypothetical protein